MKKDIKNELPVSNAYASNMALNPRTAKPVTNSVDPRSTKGVNGEVVHPRNTTGGTRADDYSKPRNDSKGNTETAPVRNNTRPADGGRGNTETAPVRNNPRATDENVTPRNTETPHIRNNTKPASEYSNPRNNGRDETETPVRGNDENPRTTTPRNNDVTAPGRNNDVVTPRTPTRTESDPRPRQRYEAPKQENNNDSYTPAPRQDRNTYTPPSQPDRSAPSAPSNNNNNSNQNNNRPRR